MATPGPGPGTPPPPYIPPPQVIRRSGGPPGRRRLPITLLVGGLVAFCLACLGLGAVVNLVNPPPTFPPPPVPHTQIPPTPMLPTLAPPTVLPAPATATAAPRAPTATSVAPLTSLPPTPIPPTPRSVPPATVTARSVIIPPPAPPTPRPVPPTARPTSASLTSYKATASVSNASPHDKTTVTVTGTLTQGGQPVAGARMDTTWKYASKPSACEGTTNSQGVASCARDISTAKIGFTVDINVTFTIGGVTVATASTSFTPQK